MKTFMATLLLLTSLAAGDYLTDRKAADELARAGKYEEALAAFTALAAATSNETQKTDALDQASQQAIRLGRPEQALELARQIPMPAHAKLAQMRVMESNRQWAQALEQFGQEDIAAWPDAIKGEGFYLRGLMAFFLKQPEPALRDLEQAVPFITNPNLKGLTLNRIGDIHRTMLMDLEKAAASYQQVLETPGAGYKACEAACKLADIQLERGDKEQAWATLQRITMTGVEHPVWRSLMLETRARTLAAMGKTTEALAEYREALKIEKLNPRDKQRIEAAIAALGHKE